ncbi:hypothetical protein FJZ39_00275 [Candidatus Saccharibacteria bacterium]|nr:hypothetical protein [Candidatus Saccharibacteria bacterium]
MAKKITKNFSESCRKREACTLADLTCPTREREMTLATSHPLLPAESLCIDALMSRAPSRRKNPYNDLIADAEDSLELALAHPEMRDRQNFFSRYLNITDELGVMRDENQPPTSQQLRVDIMSAFKPAFEARIARRAPTYKEIMMTHVALGEWAEYFSTKVMANNFEASLSAKSNLFKHKKQLAHLATEVDIMQLLTRVGSSDVFPWPTTSREESSHKRPWNNHDFYILEDYGDAPRKVPPVQVKTSKGSSGYKDVAIIKHYSVLTPYREKNASEAANLRYYVAAATDEYEWQAQSGIDKLPPQPSLRDLLREEQQQGTRAMDDGRRNLLELASSNVISMIFSQVDTTPQ